MRYLMTRPHASASRREGVVLLVVIAMLALFAAVALGFVFYADAEATAANVSRQAVSPSQADLDPELLAAYFLSQAIYDTDNIYSALRGWSFARSMYGNNPYALNFTPYNGVGRDILRYPVPFAPGVNVDNFNLINYQHFSAQLWNNTRSYSPGELVTHLGSVYQCVVANTNSPPPNASWAAQSMEPMFNLMRMPEFYATAVSITPTGAAETAPNVITITTVQPHGLAVGAKARVVGVVDSRYDGVHDVMATPPPTATTFSYAKPVGLPPLPLSGYGAAGDNNVFRYVGGANAPWTAYDTNSLFLAQVTADGKVLLPSYYRPWVSNAAAPPAAGKYMTLRPHPSWHPQFPAVEDAGGDVRNRDFGPGFLLPNGQYANNDSIWIDLGHPIMTAPNGKRYKPLFAPLILDLSNRLHLWIHGNNIGMNQSHVSNRGHGPTEVNLARGLTKADPVELQRLYQRRYGAAGPTGNAFGFRPGPYYAPEDADALDNGGTSTGPYTLPQTINVPGVPASIFPTFPSTGWNNVGPPPPPPQPEVTNKPLGFNMYLSNRLAASHMEGLARLKGTNGPGTTSEILRMMPNTFNDGPAYRNRNLVTLVNWQLDRIVSAPFLNYNRTTVVNNDYQYNALATVRRPMGGLVMNPQPNAGIPGSVVPLKSDFDPHWRSTLGDQLRVDLNRNLQPYPAHVNGVIDITNATILAAYNEAVNQRQVLARDIYNALVRVTGARDPNDPMMAPPPMAPDDPHYRASRWLAQMAANIVDFIDEDEYSTPFRWDQTAPPDEWVFGTELPRLVLNEAYAQQELSPAKINLWVELHNPFNVPVYLQTAGSPAPNPPYKIEIHSNPAGVATALASPENSKGDPPAGGPVSEVKNWGIAARTMQVFPSNGAYGDPLIELQITSATHAAGVATITTGNIVDHGLRAADIGRAIRVRDVADNGYNGLFTITAVPSNTTIQYVPGGGALPASTGGTAAVGGNNGFYVLGPEVPRYTPAARNPNLGATFISPEMTLPGGKNVNILKMGASWAGGVAMIVTGPGPHNLNKGDTVFIVGVADNQYNGGPFTVIDNSPKGNNSFTYALPSPTPIGDSGGGIVITPSSGQVTVLLRRLANPHVPFNNAPGPNYNPYITIDYIRPQFNPPNGNVQAFPSLGKRQPYSAQLAAQNPSNQGVNEPKHTFFRHNGRPSTASPFVAVQPETLDQPFDWLAHLDRRPVNSLELLHVSCFRPHELIQEFIVGPNPTDKHKHRHPWDVPETRLYRALEMIGVPSKLAGAVRGGRVPGGVNLNTLNELEVLQAICDSQDAQANPLFTQADVNMIFGGPTGLINSRNTQPDALYNGVLNPNIKPGGEGTPFRSLADGNMNTTWLRASQTFHPPSVSTDAHPYIKKALLQKIYNNVSTTSNVFAVWFTVGFFEVVDESVRPAKLGAEIGRSENRHIRHRMFAIVDRSGLQLFNTLSGPLTVLSNGVPPAPWNSTKVYTSGNNAATPPIPPDRVHFGGATYVCVQSNTGQVPTNNPLFWQVVAMNYQPIGTTANGLPLAIQPGMILEIGQIINGTFVAREAVVVPPNGVGANSFTAEFTLDHLPGSVIVCRGNPGPRTNYNPRRDSEVVLHLSVIK